jgi:hypothetical protein
MEEHARHAKQIEIASPTACRNVELIAQCCDETGARNDGPINQIIGLNDLCMREATSSKAEKKGPDIMATTDNTALGTARPIAALMRCDEQAWSTLIERHQHIIDAVCRRYRLRPEDAADVSQTVWMRELRFSIGSVSRGLCPDGSRRPPCEQPVLCCADERSPHPARRI